MSFNTVGFHPVIDSSTDEQTCNQVVTATASANIKIAGGTMLIKCITAPCYIRLGNTNSSVSAVNGYYMAIGDEVIWEPERGAIYLCYIRSGVSDGVLSIAWGNKEN